MNAPATKARQAGRHTGVFAQLPDGNHHNRICRPLLREQAPSSQPSAAALRSQEPSHRPYRRACSSAGIRLLRVEHCTAKAALPLATSCGSMEARLEEVSTRPAGGGRGTHDNKCSPRVSQSVQMWIRWHRVERGSPRC